MKIVFDSALDGRSWPISPDGMNSTLGSLKVCKLGMLGILETMLGLKGPDISDSLRAAFLVPVLRDQKDAFWARSAEVDPLGVARKLLSLRDYLWLYGWRDQPVTGRLAELAHLTKAVTPGVPDRLVAVVDSIPGHQGELPDILLHESIDSLPKTWQELFRGLEKKGAAVSEEFLSPVQANGDLGQSRETVFDPKFDGSLQLVRQSGVLQAADDIAAWLAAVARDGDLEGTVIIGGDAVLDNALNRFGLPSIGASADRYGSSLLQLLPLILAIGWEPPDPERIMELLTLPASPVPPGIARKLIKALSKWPAMGNEDWKKGLADGLEAIEDQGKRLTTKKRLDILFTSSASKGFYPLEAIADRVEMLATWLRGRFPDDEIIYAPLAQCQTLMTMVQGLGQTELSEPLLKKLLDEATASTGDSSPLPAQVGLSAVSTPEAIVGSARRIIWWNFNRDAVPAMAQPLFSEQERHKLVEAGVVLPDSAAITSNQAARWRRPLFQASEQLILVCPQTNEAGVELHPHPLWDELMAASGEKAKKLITPVVHGSAKIATISPQLRSLPVPQTRWQINPGLVAPRDCESPSSLESFLGCPFHWSLRYSALIRGGHSASLPDMVPTLGSLAHELVEEVLSQTFLPSPEEGGRLAGQLFDDKAPSMVATLFQEGMEGQREDVRATVILATRSLLQHLHDAGVTELVIEKHLTGSFGKQKLQGWADIVLSSPFTVVDLKRSWAKFFKKKMTSGTALQIVIYAWLLNETLGHYPELAYYTLEDQTFLTTDRIHFANGEHVITPQVGDVWQAFKETFNEAWMVLEAGMVLCPGNGEAVESSLDGDILTLEPPCRFCDYDVLCGRRFSV